MKESKLPYIVEEALDAATVAERIGVPLRDWPGNCSAIAAKVLSAELVTGRLRRGHYWGTVTPSSIFYKRPLVPHTWIICPDQTLYDPTRWCFFDSDPAAAFIYTSRQPKVYQRQYDAGGQRVRAAMMRPAPAHDPDDAQTALDLPGRSRRHINKLLEHDGETYDSHQIFWLANLPLPMLGEHAAPLFRALTRAGREAVIPLDNRNLVLEDEQDAS